MTLIFPVVLALTVSAAAADPCSGVGRALSEQQKVQFAPRIESHLKAQFDPRLESFLQVQPADVKQAFHFGRWYIFYVDDHATDSPYVFYSESPLQAARYVTVWAGWAQPTETAEIQEWAVKNAPNIPRKLASCFAWYVTQGSGQ